MGPARPCFGDSSRGLGTLDERSDAGPGFPGPGRTVCRPPHRDPRQRTATEAGIWPCSEATPGPPGCFAGRFLSG